MLERRVVARPQEARFHSELGIKYAALGRTADAVRQGEAAAMMLPVAHDALSGVLIQYQLAQICARTGKLDTAIAVLRDLCGIPSLVSAKQLAVEPYWSVLRKDVAFRRVCRAG